MTQMDTFDATLRPTPARRAILVLGMHRAGTSALARVLSLRGAALPSDIMLPNDGNPTGYWEPRALVDFNDRLLAYFGADWNDPFAGAKLPAEDAIPAHFYREAADIVAREYGQASLVVIKDPRCTLLAGFWCRVLEASGVKPCPVVIMRPSMEVAQSLLRRDGSPLGASVAAYNAYAACCVQFAQSGRTVTFLTYAQLLEDWAKASDRIAVDHGFAWPAHSESVAGQVDSFLLPNGRSTMEPETGSAVPAALKTVADGLWDWIQARASGGFAAPVEAVLETVRQDGERFAPVLAERVQRLAVKDEAIEAAQRVAEGLIQQRDELSEQRAELLQQCDELVQQRDEFERDRNRLLVLYRQLEHDRQGEHAQHLELRSRYDDAVVRLEQMTAHRDAVERERDASRAQLDTILGSRSWALTRPLRCVTRLGRGLVAASLRATVGRARAHSVLARARALTKLPVAAQMPDPGHGALSAFLDAEFGGATTRSVIERIDSFGLPVGQGRHVDVSEGTEALAWARALVEKIPQSSLTEHDPVVSIVIPVYNQVRFTLACLDALVAHRTRHRFEILIGDDNSSDPTPDALAIGIPGVRVLRHAVNLGFVKNCNATAVHARGRYVVFLNNDTLVLPNWLDELVDTLEADPAIGLAGSKLIYPDGRLQECGAIVWNDGSAWNFGRLDDPRRPEYCYLRDVDYVSGASIALPRVLWEKLGGFDELFVPAYAEDADLAFRVRADGLRTVVQPLSQVLHFEGVTSGTDTGQGVKAYQVANLRKLAERWGDVISTHRANGDQSDLEKERGTAKRVLFIDHVTPTPDADAGSVVAWEVMAAFRELGYKVTFIPEDNFAHMGEETRRLQRIGIETIYHPSYSSMSDFLARRNDPFEVIFLHRYKVADRHLRELRGKFSSARTIFLNADMHFLREMRQAELTGNADAMSTALKTRDRELGVVKQVDCTLVHSSVELEILREQCPDAAVHLFPLIQDPISVPQPIEGREGVCFIGGYRHPPNVDAIVWFVDTVWPKVVARRPEAHLYIVGSHAPDEVVGLGNVPNVEFVGFVEDLTAFLDRRRVSVAPLRYGAGAKGKVALSLAHGLPVVCTPVAMEGMQLNAGVDVRVAENGDELADHLVELMTDDDAWARMAAAGVLYADTVTARRHAHSRVQGLLQELGKG